MIAPNAFKNSLAAAAAAEAICKGFLQSRLSCNCERFPIGDGGDGTGELIIQRLGGNYIPATARDPLQKEITTSIGLIDGGRTAVIEMANASGIKLLNKRQLDPLNATSIGTGDLIRLALDKKVERIILGMGGTATIDGGVGILYALGARFYDRKNNELDPIPKTLHQLTRIDIANIDPRLANTELIILCDVDNPLLGPEGAAMIFGPQKGASADVAIQIESALKRYSEIVYQQTGKMIASLQHSGAAGGAAGGLHALIQARLVNGIDYFLELSGFDEALQQCQLLVTGEGSLDKQSLRGKGTVGVATRAKKKGIPVVGLAGKVPLKPDPLLKEYFDVLLSIGNEPSDLEGAMVNTAANLTRVATEIGNMLALH